MQDWEVDFKWLEVRHKLKERFKRSQVPDLNAVLFLIGIRELGHHRPFSKEEKQDLMHIAICKLLEEDGIYEFVGKDDDGWPHYEINKQLPQLKKEEQEDLLKRRIIQYFEEIF